MTPLYWRELRDADLTKVVLIDVRTPDEYSLGHIEGSVNIPLDEMRDRLDEIPPHKPVYVYCGVGLRGYLASNILKANGFEDVRNLIGGVKTYKAAVTKVCPAGADKVQCGREADEACSCRVEEQTEIAEKTVTVDAAACSAPDPY